MRLESANKNVSRKKGKRGIKGKWGGKIRKRRKKGKGEVLLQKKKGKGKKRKREKKGPMKGLDPGPEAVGL